MDLNIYDQQFFAIDMESEAVQRRLDKLANTDAEGDGLLATLIKPGKALPKDARAFEIHPGLWGGIGLIRQGTGTTLVGDPEGVAALMREYEKAGAEVFILGNYPHIEEAYRFSDMVMPLLGMEKGRGRVAWY